jgi:hypothetical protein
MVRENDECLQHANCAASTGHNNVQLYRGQQAIAATSFADAPERENVKPQNPRRQPNYRFLMIILMHCA